MSEEKKSKKTAPEYEVLVYGDDLDEDKPQVYRGPKSMFNYQWLRAQLGHNNIETAPFLDKKIKKSFVFDECGRIKNLPLNVLAVETYVVDGIHYNGFYGKVIVCPNAILN
jgi:hypothetical protein